MEGKVVGLGGVFIKFQDPKKMRNWYELALGVQTNDYGILFRFNHNLAPKPGFLQVGTFDASTDYFGAETQQFMLNFRVDSMDAMLERLKLHSVKLAGEVSSYDYGKFLHIEDPEGNRIELWEAIDNFTSESEKGVDMY